MPVSPLHLSLLSPWSVFPPTPFFSVEVSLAAVDLDTWSGLFSHSVPSSHSTSIIPSLFWLSLAHSCLSVQPVFVYTSISPSRLAYSPFLQKRFPQSVLFLPPPAASLHLLRVAFPLCSTHLSLDTHPASLTFLDCPIRQRDEEGSPVRAQAVAAASWLMFCMESSG